VRAAMFSRFHTLMAASSLFGLVTNSSRKRAGFDFRVISGYLKPCDLRSVNSTMTSYLGSLNLSVANSWNQAATDPDVSSRTSLSASIKTIGITSPRM
jgi:hypothetical protein